MAKKRYDQAEIAKWREGGSSDLGKTPKSSRFFVIIKSVPKGDIEYVDFKGNALPRGVLPESSIFLSHFYLLFLYIVRKYFDPPVTLHYHEQ